MDVKLSLPLLSSSSIRLLFVIPFEITAIESLVEVDDRKIVECAVTSRVWIKEKGVRNIFSMRLEDLRLENSRIILD